MRDGYSTHIEGLAWAVSHPAVQGLPVLECGAGWYSTPLLHGACEATGRELLTIESRPEWIDPFLPWLRSWHTFELLSEPDDWLEACRRQSWGVALVDSGAAPIARGPLIAALLVTAKIVVVHDRLIARAGDGSYYPWAEGMDEALDSAKYRREWTDSEQGTTAVSNVLHLKESR